MPPPGRLLRLGLLPALAVMALVAVIGGASAMRAGGASWPLVLGVPCVLPAAALALRRLFEGRKRQDLRRTAAVVFALGMVLRIAVSLSVRNEPVSDFAAYHELAGALISGQGYALTGPAGLEDVKLYLGGSTALPRPTAFRAPGAAFWGALLGARAELFKAVNAVLGGATSALLFLLLAEHEFFAGLAAGVLWACYPSAVFAANLFGSEPLFAFFLALLAWLVSRRSNAAAAAAGIDAGWCCLIRPPWLLPLAAMAGAWCRPKRGMDGFRRLVLAASFMALTIAPWTLRNWRVFHRVIGISTSQGVWLALHTSFHLPVGKTDDPAWKSLVASWTAADEPARAELGYRMARYHLVETVKAGPSVIAASVGDAIRGAFDSDGDMIIWGSMRRFALREDGDPDVESAFGPAARGRWLMLNHAFYAGMLLLAVRGLCRPGAPALLELESVRCLAVYFLLLFSIYCAIPAKMPRYHFSMMLLTTLLAGYGAAQDSKVRLKLHADRL